MRFRMHDGTEVAGRSYEDVVRNMATMKFTPATDLDAYRRATATRVHELYEVDVDPTDARSFITSLVDGEVLTVVTVATLPRGARR